jgi:hypothetical protein
VITKRRCPHTGIVNFYSKADPLLAIGSLTEAAAPPSEYVWRCYVGDHEAGVAAGISTAEERLRRAIARGLRTEPGPI